MTEPKSLRKAGPVEKKARPIDMMEIIERTIM